LLHLWGHVLAKGLLFLGAGSILHGAGTKDLERLGGLMRRMPATGAFLTLGAVAIAALPPLGGFVSEWLMYLGLLHESLTARNAPGLAALLAIGGLALVGGLATLCFVRLLGIALLGQPRSDDAGRAHESSAWMLGPMSVLAAAGVLLAIQPAVLVEPLTGVVEQLGGVAAAEAMVASVAPPLRLIGLCNAVVWAVVGALAVTLHLLVRSRRSADETWGCGYAAPTPRMQYTARSFADFVAGRLLPRPLQARIRQRPPAALFPVGSAFASEATDPWTRALYEPFLSRWANRFARLRWLQQGQLHAYLLYILAVVVVSLAWISLRALDL
jgi:NADH:ubiquinone oxidoreductase subunit 5 (subunit L)/multisubunit Na+/H+ antiporter MnhA subunit